MYPLSGCISLLPGSYTHAASIIDENTLIVNSTQQQRIVKGTVIDANGEPLIGVNVKEVGEYWYNH